LVRHLQPVHCHIARPGYRDHRHSLTERTPHVPSRAGRQRAQNARSGVLWRAQISSCGADVVAVHTGREARVNTAGCSICQVVVVSRYLRLLR
jgi:hypothetical protein